VKRILLIALMVSTPALADVDLKFSGMIYSDIRYRLAGEPINLSYPSQQQLLGYGFSRNDNLIKGRLSLGIADRVKAVGDVDLVLYGFSDAKDIDALTLHERIDPYRLEVHAAYVDLYRVLPGLDLRIGRQTVVWGVADQFNPTSNLNTLDFSDPLLFGRALANNMVRADYNPKGDWIFTAVFVPIFRPAELPRTAPIALNSATDRPAPVQDDQQRLFLWNTALSPIGPNTVNVFTQQPEPSLANAQFAFRAGGRVFGQDVSLSYYHGRFGIPSPLATVNHLDRTADVLVGWPRMDVLGADVAGSITPLAGMGYWVEGALVFPQQTELSVYNDLANTSCPGNQTPCRQELRFDPFTGSPVFGTVGPNGYLRVPDGVRSTVIPSTPFLKLTIGGDMSIGSHVYVNFQYIHGFIDEFGAGTAVHPRLHPNDPYTALRFDGRIGDYIVAGVDVHLFSDRLLGRLFAVAKLPSILYDTNPDGTSNVHFEDYKFTGVLFPQLIWSVWEATELTLGAFLFLGGRDTKFGDPAAGASELFLKCKFTY